MATATLRSLGGSVVLTVPKKVLSLIHLDVGAEVDLSVRGGKLIVAPRKQPRYTLRQLLARCDKETWTLTTEDRTWLRSKSVGKEAR